MKLGAPDDVFPESAICTSDVWDDAWTLIRSSLPAAWLAVETGRECLRRRRLALGLGDPETSNRIGLWCLASATIVLLCVVALAASSSRADFVFLSFSHPRAYR